MADSKVDITAGSGIEIDTRTETDNGQHRQVVVLGDPSTTAGVAPVDATAGLKVDLGTDNDVTAVLGAGTAEIGKLAAGVAEIGNVKNSGTFATQATLQAGTAEVGKLAAGTALVGKVSIDQVTANANEVVLKAGTAAFGKLAANSGVDIGDVTLTAGTASIGKLAANTGVDIGDVDVTSITGVTMSNAAIQTTGDEAHDAADAGNPVKVGGKAVAFDGTAPGTDVAEADRTNFITTVEGRQFVETTHPNYWTASADYASAQTNATVKAAAGASLKLYITDIIVSNGATAGNITLLDGSAGTVKLELYPAINGGATISLRTPIALTANTLLAITSTTVTTHSVTVSGFIAA